MERLKIGSLVTIGDEEVKVLVVGYFMKHEDSYTDYGGVLYPYGLGSLEDVIYFNHSDVKKVLKEGYESDMTNRYQQLLTQFEKRHPRSSVGGE